MVEHSTADREVPGSIPGVPFFSFFLFLFFCSSPPPPLFLFCFICSVIFNCVCVVVDCFTFIQRYFPLLIRLTVPLACDST